MAFYQTSLTTFLILTVTTTPITPEMLPNFDPLNNRLSMAHVLLQPQELLFGTKSRIPYLLTKGLAPLKNNSSDTCWTLDFDAYIDIILMQTLQSGPLGACSGPLRHRLAPGAYHLSSYRYLGLL